MLTKTTHKRTQHKNSRNFYQLQHINIRNNTDYFGLKHASNGKSKTTRCLLVDRYLGYTGFLKSDWSWTSWT